MNMASIPDHLTLLGEAAPKFVEKIKRAWDGVDPSPPSVRWCPDSNHSGSCDHAATSGMVPPRG